MPQIRDGVNAEGTLGPFDEQPVLMQHGEDSAHMAKVFSQGGVVDQYVVEEDKDEAAQEGAENVVHQCLECCGGIAQPNGITYINLSYVLHFFFLLYRVVRLQQPAFEWSDQWEVLDKKILVL